MEGKNVFINISTIGMTLFKSFYDILSAYLKIENNKLYCLAKNNIGYGLSEIILKDAETPNSSNLDYENEITLFLVNPATADDMVRAGTPTYNPNYFVKIHNMFFPSRHSIHRLN